jgi:hypothetical protein
LYNYLGWDNGATIAAAGGLTCVRFRSIVGDDELIYRIARPNDVSPNRYGTDTEREHNRIDAKERMRDGQTARAKNKQKKESKKIRYN